MRLPTKTLYLVGGIIILVFESLYLGLIVFIFADDGLVSASLQFYECPELHFVILKHGDALINVALGLIERDEAVKRVSCENTLKGVKFGIIKKVKAMVVLQWLLLGL